MDKLTTALQAASSGLLAQGPDFLGKGIALGLESIAFLSQLDDGLDAGKVDAIVLGQRLNLAQQLDVPVGVAAATAAFISASVYCRASTGS